MTYQSNIHVNVIAAVFEGTGVEIAYPPYCLRGRKK